MRATGPVAAILSAVSAIGTQLRDPINSGLARWQFTVKLDAFAETRTNLVSKRQTQSEYVENERADAGKAEPV